VVRIPRRVGGSSRGVLRRAVLAASAAAACAQVSAVSGVSPVTSSATSAAAPAAAEAFWPDDVVLPGDSTGTCWSAYSLAAESI
jgi:hypothetical protein